MELITDIVNVLTYLDQYLEILVIHLGFKIYIIMFIIVFFESAFIVTPFLPGNSLLFIAGSLASVGEINLAILIIVIVLAASSGGFVNYSISRAIGNKLLKNKILSKFINENYLKETKKFYDEKGGKTLIFSKFVPVVRTFSPFLAGMSKMNFVQFSIYNITSSIIWVISVSGIGYLFGNVGVVKNNYSTVMLIIFCIYIIIAIYGFIRKNIKTKND